MRPKLLLPLVAGVIAVAVAAYFAGVQRGAHSGAAPAQATAAAVNPVPTSTAEGEAATRRHIAAGLKAGDIDPATGTKILFYRDPMVPGNRFDRPAKSPFMDMMLVPVYAGGETDASSVTVSPRIQQSLGLRTAEVVQGALVPRISTVGSIAFNERDQVNVQARATAFVERLFVRATLDRVTAGQALAELYVPEWIAAQEEFLSIRRMSGTDLAPLVDGARQRMRQVGMSDALIRLVDSSGQAQPRFTLTAPIGGVVVELLAREGMTVMAGATLMRINGLATVWANAEVPESQSASLRVGGRVLARSPAVPGTTFEGRVQAILPEVNAATRTLKARMELANPGARLVPGMFVQMQFADGKPDKTLLVPTEAVIQTGRRTLVMLAEDGGRFRTVEIEAGLEAEGQTEVRRGLQAGQRVVVSSQFLIDSEASLRGLETRLNTEPQAASSTRHEAEAVVESIAADALMLSHGPIPSLKWGPMTMEFKPPAGGTGELRAGDRVRIEFVTRPDGVPQLTAIARLSGKPGDGKQAPAHDAAAHGSHK